MASVSSSSQLAISPVVYILVIWFGVSSWLSVNSLWVELPVIVGYLPEEWALPSYLTVIIQVANIGPILIAVANKIYPDSINQKLLICVLLLLGVVATFLLSFLWSVTAVISGAERSVGLFVIVFIIAFVNCSSSVTFIPYMAVFRHEYVTAYFIGSGLSGLLPAILSLSQGVGGNNDCVNRTVINTTTINESVAVNTTDWVLEPIVDTPNFSARSFFIAISVLMLLSCSAFVALITWPVARRHQYQAVVGTSGDDGGVDAEEKTVDESVGISAPPTKLPTFIYLLVLVSVVNGLSNTALYSVQTYSCLPYGNMAYHVTVATSSVANPLGAFLPFWLHTASPLALTALTTIAAAISSYIFLTAAMSPHPPLYDQDSGRALVILSWTLAIGLLSYIKTLLAGVLRGEGRRGLLMCGIFTQIGSAIGAFTLFPLVNYYDVFQASDACNSIRPG